MKISELMGNYEDYLTHERRLAEGTRRNYLSDMKMLLTYIDDQPIAVIDQKLVRAWMRDMSHKKLSTATIHRRINATSTFFNWLMLEKQVIENPTSGIKLPKKTIRQPSYLSVEDLRRFVETPSPHQINYQLMAWLGLRVSEMLRLRWEDIRLDEKIVTIRNTKNKQDRVLPLPDELVRILTVFAQQHGYPQTGYLFPGSEPDTHWERYNFRRTFAAYADTLGLKITTHWLRHSFATHMMRQGVDVTVISKMLGHKHLNSTGRYLHHAQDILRTAIERHVLKP